MNKIYELYDKKIERRINPAVVVSELDEESIDQEIKEYVFTQTLAENIHKYLNALVHQSDGKSGIWINGYYGSGKSHFLKYLYYALNPKYSEDVFNHFLDYSSDLDPLGDINRGSISQLQRDLKKLSVHQILFNIDAVSKSRDNEDNRITSILFNKFNEFRGYNKSNIALALYLEKPLDENGVFAEFKNRIKTEYNEDWDGNQRFFIRRYLSKVIEIAKEFDQNIDQDALTAAIVNKTQDYTIDDLISELKSFMDKQDDYYRLVFLLDEVSQYIGTNTALLLNLQTIIEEIGSQIGMKVWIACTAQQDLKELVKASKDKTVDFGKILGRFETMISLESQDASYITKKRILDKKSEGIEVLNGFYSANKGDIENQFIFDHDHYDNYHDKDDFLLTYPFIPYQFRLISDVFEAFSNLNYVVEGVKNTERSILGITHFTAGLCKNKEVGYFVPFDLFFNETFKKNLTQRARSILDKAYQLKAVKEDAFAIRVVNTLFMVSNLSESQSINLPSTIENIALLMVDAANITKVDMQDKVQVVVDELAKQNIIQISEGKCRFLKDDEIDVANQISNTHINNETRCDLFYNNIIGKIINPKQTVKLNNKDFKISTLVDEKVIYQKGDFTLTFSVFDTNDLDYVAHQIPSSEIRICINDWWMKDQALKEMFEQFAKTQAFLSTNQRGSNDTRNQTLITFKENNNNLLKDLLNRFEKKMMQTPFITHNRVVQANEINSSSVSQRHEDILLLHLSELYKKSDLAKAYASNNAEFLNHAQSKQKLAIKELDPAEEELNNKLNLLGSNPIVSDVVKDFEKAPYGWKDVCTLDVLLRIAQKGYRRFEWRNDEIDLESFAQKALNSRERDAILIHREKSHTIEEIKSFIKLVNHEIFNETMVQSSITDYKEAADACRTAIGKLAIKINNQINELENYPFAVHLRNYHQSLRAIYDTRTAENLQQEIESKKDTLLEQMSVVLELEDFVGNNQSKYDEIKAFVESNLSNLQAFEDDMLTKAEKLIEYFKKDSRPWDDFPLMKKAYKELHLAIKERSKELKGAVYQLYESVFADIDAHRIQLGITDAHLTADKNTWLRKIEKENDIQKLEIFELKAAEFKADNIKSLDEIIAKEKAKEKGEKYTQSVDISVARELGPVTIETPEQLDDYIDKLRKQLMVKLSKHKKIFLN